MNRSRYENRAKWLNANYNAQKRTELPINIPRDEYWQNYVKTKEDIEQFYKLYYPQLPDVLSKALADYYQKAVDGQITLPEDFTKKAPKREWNYEEEIREQMLQGKIELTRKRLDALMKDEEEKQ